MNISIPEEPIAARQPVFSQPALNALFLSNLSDVYNLLNHLVSLIPEMVRRASYTNLKLSILRKGNELEAQLLRINFIFKYRKYDAEQRPTPLLGPLNIRGYLLGSMETLDTHQVDYILLTQLIIIENLEISHFKILSVMSKGIHHKNIHRLIKLCLREALKEKRTFATFTQVYQAQP
jgi:ferritin-like metal-binding protein YciE